MPGFGYKQKKTIFITKICKNCDLEKEHTSKGTWCVECVSKFNSDYKLKKKPELREKREKFYKRGRFNLSYLDRRKDTQLYRKYNISLQDYNRILNEQKECCRICGKHQSLFKRKLLVDHDHTTNKVRGLLCLKCNSGLGNAEDNIQILKNMINYLKYYKEK